MDDEKIKVAHIWQEFRIRCLKLAIKGGATEENMIEVAEKLGTYIITQSKTEIGVVSSAEGKSE